VITRSTAILAPRRVPPCAISPNALSYTRKKPTGPVACPADDATYAPLAASARTKSRCRRRSVDQRRVAQRLKDAVAAPAHVVRDRQHKAGRQLPQRRAAPVNVGELGKKRRPLSSS